MLELDKNRNGKQKCFYCGGDVSRDSSFLAQDLYTEEYADDYEAEVCELHCTNCGRGYEIIMPTKQDRETLYNNYWQHMYGD